eukprot:3667110-Amphidinium_carterae.1
MADVEQLAQELTLLTQEFQQKHLRVQQVEAENEFRCLRHRQGRSNSLDLLRQKYCQANHLLGQGGGGGGGVARMVGERASNAAKETSGNTRPSSSRTENINKEFQLFAKTRQVAMIVAIQVFGGPGTSRLRNSALGR